MNVPPIHYRSVRSRRELVHAKGSTVRIIAEDQWSSAAPDDKKARLVFEVEGEIRDEARSYGVKWYFDWPNKDLAKVEAALELILRYVTQTTNPGILENEAYTDVYDWLRLGYRDQAGKVTYYLDFTKGNHRMRSVFADAEGLAEFKNALRSCISGGKGAATAAPVKNA